MTPRLRAIIACGALCAAAAARCAYAWMDSGPAIPTVGVRAAAHAVVEHEAAGLCPWRDPDGDRERFFPGSTSAADVLVIATDRRRELAAGLGRRAGPEDYAARVYRVYDGSRGLGTIVPRRVSGQDGLIELVLAVSPAGRVLGYRIQRSREPDEIDRELESPGWQAAFRGRTEASGWRLGSDIPNVSQEARQSAEAVLDGAHAALVLLSLGDRRHV